MLFTLCGMALAYEIDLKKAVSMPEKSELLEMYPSILVLCQGVSWEDR